MSLYLAVDIGGTQLRLAAFHHGDPTPLLRRRITTQGASPTGQAQAPLERLVELIDSAWPEAESVAVIAVAAPGPVNPHAGIVYEAPNIPGWEDLPLRQALEERFKVPVLLGNDANLAALGEWRYGAGQGHHNMVYLTISTGIGSGIIVDDRLLVGASGLAAELGHITVVPGGPLCGCGRQGHLEAFASGTAIARWVRSEIASGRTSSVSDQPVITAKTIAEAALQGDRLSIEAIERAGTYMGHVLADVLHLFNPTAVIIGGGVSQSGPLLFDPLRRALQERLFNPHYLDNLLFTQAALGDDVGLIGGYALGSDRYPPPA